MERRAFIITVTAGFAAVPMTLRAADLGPFHIGIVGLGSGLIQLPMKAFRERLAEMGYVEGQNIVISALCP